jgi:hypothetical protein
MPWLDGTDYWWVRFCFERGLGLIYLVAFLAAAFQFRPLCGARGLLPVPLFLKRVSFRQAPSLFWWRCDDRAFAVAAWTGVGLALAAITGLSEQFGLVVSMGVWFVLWALYLSFVNVGQTFYSFGWESILCETGFLAIFLGDAHTAPPILILWLLCWVLFRVMFGAGLIKLRGDPCWRDLTCLYYHYETQPMPNPLSWYFHHSPKWLHRVGVGFNHFAELIAPFGVFLPPPICYIAGGVMILFQVTLILSGNLSWLNYLTLVLCIPAFDDALVGAVIPASAPAMQSGPLAFDLLVIAVTALVIALSYRPVVNMLSPKQVMNRTFDSLHLVGTYGAFGGITRQRYEVILEGTHEPAVTAETRWHEYRFKGKIGDVKARPAVVAPYHLRLDWQMWFASLTGSYRQHPWLLHLVAKLLINDKPTVGLLLHNPFPDAPPTHIRAWLYHYRFTTRAEWRETGQWWMRTPVRQYLPALSLDDESFVELLRAQGWWQFIRSAHDPALTSG